MSALKDFVTAVADEQRGRLRTRGEHLELELPGRSPVIIDSDPKEPQVSRDRLEFVEKQAAIALLAEPRSFSVSVKDDAWKRNQRLTLLRVAFGYYVVNGARCFQRYTAYYDTRNDVGAVLEGDDNLFSSSTEDVELEFSQMEISAARLKLVLLVQFAYQHFITGHRQVQEFQAIADHQRHCLFELDLLYRRTSKQHIRTFGVDLNDLKSRPPSVSDEFHRRKLDVVTRHVPKVAATILSTGVVISPVKGQKKRVQMPFLPEPTDRRWLMSWQAEPNKTIDSDEG